MIDFKLEIAKKIANITNVDINDVIIFIEIPKDNKNGDYAFPCFRLAKTLKKSPQIIANDIKENIKDNLDEYIEKIDVVGGYLNFYINKNLLINQVLQEFSKQNEFGKSEYGKNKNVVIDYSAPNIAKPFHIGHLRSTVIGGALYNIYKYLGFNVTGVNHLGDYGTQFGKLIEGYKLWGNEYDIENDPINELTKIYVRINKLCKEDESVLEKCRDNFKKLEDGDKYCVELWQKFKELSLKEFKKVYDMLGSKFDSWNGEAFYADKMDEIVEILENYGKLKDSQGAKIVDLESDGIDTPCIIVKSNGSTTYATRDLAALMYRTRTYDFDRCIYVTSYEQVLHFKQIFAVAKYLKLDEKYLNGLVHVPFGMVQLPTGKMSTRDGNIVKLEDLLNEAINRAKIIIEEKNPSLENKDEVAKKVGIGAVIFNDLSTNRLKDEIFDWNTILNFQGETGPYIQYTYVRTKSVIEKCGKIPDYKDIDINILNDEYSLNIIKLLYDFENILIQVTEKNEPSILARFLLDLAKSYSSFYNENKIICDDKNIQDARVFLTFITGCVLKQGAKLLCIEMPDKM